MKLVSTTDVEILVQVPAASVPDVPCPITFLSAHVPRAIQVILLQIVTFYQRNHGTTLPKIGVILHPVVLILNVPMVSAAVYLNSKEIRTQVVVRSAY